MKTKFADMPKDFRKTILWEFTRELLPLGKSENAVFRFKDGFKAIAKYHVVKKMTCKMGESVQYKKKEKGKKGKKRDLPDESPDAKSQKTEGGKGGKGGRSGKGGKGGKRGQATGEPTRAGTSIAQACTGVAQGEATQSTILLEDGTEREKMFLDLIIETITSASDGYGIATHFQNPVSHAAYRFMYVFMLECTVDLGSGKGVRKWTAVSPSVKKFIECQRKLTSQETTSQDFMSEMKAILQAVGGGSISVDPYEPYQKCFDKFIASDNQAELKNVKDFLTENNVPVPLALLPLTQCIQRQMWSDLKGVRCHSESTIPSFVASLSSHLFAVLKPEWAQAASAAVTLSGKESPGGESALGNALWKQLFPSNDDLERFLGIRTAIALYMLAFFAQANPQAIAMIPLEKVEGLKQRTAELTNGDSLQGFRRWSRGVVGLHSGPSFSP